MDQNLFTILFDLKFWWRLKKFLKCSPEKQYYSYIAHKVDKRTGDYRSVNIVNTTLFIHKTVHSNLGFPHRLCTHYKSIDAISQSDCLRKCLTKYLENFLDCSPIIINGIIS
jgi:hypothetical protein